MLIKAREFISPEIDSLYMMKLAEIDILGLKKKSCQIRPNSLTKKLLSKLSYSLEARELHDQEEPFLIPSKSLQNQLLDVREELVHSNLELNKVKLVVVSLVRLLDKSLSISQSLLVAESGSLKDVLKFEQELEVANKKIHTYGIIGIKKSPIKSILLRLKEGSKISRSEKASPRKEKPQ